MDGRIDQFINSKQQVYVRFNWKNQLVDVANPLLPNDVNSEHDRSFLVSHNWVINPNLLNEFRLDSHTRLSPNFPIEGARSGDPGGIAVFLRKLFGHQRRTKRKPMNERLGVRVCV